MKEIKLMDIPKSDCRITGDTEDVYGLMNDFFINAKEYIESKLTRDISDYFKIDAASLSYGPLDIISDNRINHLNFRDKYLIAAMLETRTEGNNVQFTFFRDLSCLEELLNCK